MFLVVVSSSGVPDFWSFEDWDLVSMLEFRDELRSQGRSPLVLHVSSSGVRSVFDEAGGV